jgi:hypothetical protein
MTKDNINLGLLFKVMSVQSKSRKDDIMRTFLKNYFDKVKLKVEEDTYGNLYITKGKAKSYPCVVAHIDTVHTLLPSHAFKVFRMGSLLYAMNALTGTQTGIGGDDKVGIYIALHVLHNHKNVKVVLYRDEEIGHIGSKHSIKENKEFYKDCNFVIQCDRKGDDDFLTSSGGIKMCSEEFITATKPYADKHEYKEGYGISTDVDTLVREGIGISCINLSSGYHRPHSSTEVVNIDDVRNVASLVDEMITNLGETKFEYKYVKPVYSYNSRYSGMGPRVGSNGIIYFTKKFNYVDVRFRRMTQPGFKKLDKVEIRNSCLINPREETPYLPKDIKMPIPLPDTAKCIEKTAIKHKIVYMMEEDIFFCLSCQTPIISSYMKDKLYRMMTIEDGGLEFVYDHLNNIWIQKEKAIWKPIQGTYIAKSVGGYWR